MASQIQKTQALARKFDLKPHEVAKLMDNPDLFLDRVLALIRARHVDQADAILKALERKAKQGDVKAAECWLRFIGRTERPKAEPAAKTKPAKSKQIDAALKWLPSVTVEVVPENIPPADKETAY